MWRLALFFLALASTRPARGGIEIGPAVRVAEVTRDAYAPLFVHAIVADGKGGSVAFGTLFREEFASTADIVATPIDTDGTPHPERAIVVASNTDNFSNLASNL